MYFLGLSWNPLNTAWYLIDIMIYKWENRVAEFKQLWQSLRQKVEKTGRSQYPWRSQLTVFFSTVRLKVMGLSGVRVFVKLSSTKYLNHTGIPALSSSSCQICHQLETLPRLSFFLYWVDVSFFLQLVLMWPAAGCGLLKLTEFTRSETALDVVRNSL